MQKIEFEGETYYYINGRFTDSSFIEVDIGLRSKLAEKVFTNVDYKCKSQAELVDYLKELKEAEVYSLAKEVCLFCLEKYSEDDYLIRTVLPILTSCYRKIGQPSKAIELLKIYPSIYNQHGSVALLTSLAAAFCDVGDYINARKYANIAYARQGGGTGEKNELSLVYMRIKKEFGEEEK